MDAGTRKGGRHLVPHADVTPDAVSATLKCKLATCHRLMLTKKGGYEALGQLGQDEPASG